MRRLVVAVGAFLVVSTGCGEAGDRTRGMRVKLFDDLSFWKTEGSGREFRGSCPPGRFVVDFRLGEEIALKRKTRVVASLTTTEAFIGCADARIHKPKLHQGRAYIGPRVTQVQDSTKLVCSTTKRIEIIVSVAYKFEDTFAGGRIEVYTPRHPDQRRGRLLVSAGVTDDGDSYLSYHLPRCRVVGS
jgi:hypothetical protein